MERMLHSLHMEGDRGGGGVYEQEHNHDGVSCAMSLLPEIL